MEHRLPVLTRVAVVFSLLALVGGAAAASLAADGAMLVYLPLIMVHRPGEPNITPTPTSAPTDTPTTIPTSTPTSLPSPTATSVPGAFANGDFEAFPPGVGWQQYSSEGRQLVVPGRSLDPPVIPSSGQYLAALKVEVSEARSQIWQDVTLPASGPIYLNWNFLIISKEWCDVPWYDFFAIYVGGQLVLLLPRRQRPCRADRADPL